MFLLCASVYVIIGAFVVVLLIFSNSAFVSPNLLNSSFLSSSSIQRLRQLLCLSPHIRTTAEMFYVSAIASWKGRESLKYFIFYSHARNSLFHAIHLVRSDSFCVFLALFHFPSTLFPWQRFTFIKTFFCRNCFCSSCIDLPSIALPHLLYLFSLFHPSSTSLTISFRDGFPRIVYCFSSSVLAPFACLACFVQQNCTLLVCIFQFCQ